MFFQFFTRPAFCTWPDCRYAFPKTMASTGYKILRYGVPRRASGRQKAYLGARCCLSPTRSVVRSDSLSGGDGGQTPLGLDQGAPELFAAAHLDLGQITEDAQAGPSLGLNSADSLEWRFLKGFGDTR
jgi:hypothetical protein